LKRKLLIFVGISALIIFQMIQFSRAYHNPTPLISGSNFIIEVNTGQALAFQTDDTLQIEVLMGFLNGSSWSLTVFNDGGTLSFLASNDSTVEVTSPDAKGAFDININGANQTSFLGDFTWNAVIKTGDNIRILWGWRIESWIDKYTMFAIGMGGLILMVASPSWVAWQLRKGGIKPEDFERIMYGLLLFCVGFGLLVMWLW